MRFNQYNAYQVAMPTVDERLKVLRNTYLLLALFGAEASKE